MWTLSWLESDTCIHQLFLSKHSRLFLSELWESDSENEKMNDEVRE